MATLEECSDRSSAEKKMMAGSGSGLRERRDGTLQQGLAAPRGTRQRRWW
jgi:hypothetical protein